MEKEVIRQEEAKKILDDLNEKYHINRLAELIKDNKVEFEHKEKNYRVRLLNNKDKDELDELRRKKFGQLIQDKDILLEKDLEKIYKERGIDVESISNNIKKLESEESNMRLKLGEALSQDSGDSVLSTYKKEIEEIQEKIGILALQKSTLMQYSLENQLLNYVAELITYLSLDVLEDNKWKKCFNDFDTFRNCEDKELIERTASISLILQYLY